MQRRVFFQISAIMIVLFFLAGCRSESAGEEGGNGDQVEITWLVRSNPALVEWYDRVVDEFQKEHPSIQVELQIIPQTEIDQKLMTMIAGGNVPDVWSPNWADSGFSAYHALGALMDLSPFLEQDPDVVDGIDESLVEIYATDEGVFGVPFLQMGSFVYYNKALFEEAGLPDLPTDWDDKSWDWDKMVEYGKAITDADGNPTQRVYGVMNDNYASKDAWMFGGDFFKDADYERGEMTTPVITEDPRNYEAIQSKYDLIHKHGVHPPQNELSALSQLSDPFLSGRIGMVLKGGWGTRQYAGTDMDWGIAPYPYTNEGREVPLYVDPWSISAETEHPEESWEFVKFLMNPEKGAKWIVEMALETPAHGELKELWYELIAERTGLSVDALREVDQGALRFGRPSDNHLIKDFSPILRHMNMTINAVYDGQKSVEDGLAELQENLKTLNY
ncbi:sugar ABC transporter substrate-binding protein [Bacillaceae bacterium SIJ1]|uniref:ABC transporter substrate-binding protein n=1 Tax=Litoribacterium kuwaitense TaxID=1398745 RepID=UPI0013EA8BEB|nr:sugar ABC transporter substrate-binding protein [Litoribacterium kuwaitense]NGP45290.1 sugar ABC transporter substrate-binding protein [Litoribacterium kuwaitense]